jgi:hypothetical protein
VERLEENVPLGRSRPRWNSNIEMGLYQIGRGQGKIDLVEEGNKYRAILTL